MVQETKELVQEKVAPEETTKKTVGFPVDIYTGKNAYYLEASLPGATQESIEVTIDHEKRLVIQGSVKDDKTPEVKPVYKEFETYNYKRAFHIDDKIDINQIDAAYKEGILSITLPLAEPVTKKIEVKTGA